MKAWGTAGGFWRVYLITLHHPVTGLLIAWYVGITCRGNQRIRQHQRGVMSNPFMTELVKAGAELRWRWLPDEYDSEHEAAIAEDRALRVHAPASARLCLNNKNPTSASTKYVLVKILRYRGQPFRVTTEVGPRWRARLPVEAAEAGMSLAEYVGLSPGEKKSEV